MRHSRRWLHLDFMAMAVAAICLPGNTALAQEGDAAKPGAAAPVEAPAQPEKAPAIQVIFQALQAGAPRFEDFLEQNRQSFRTLLISELHFCRRAGDLSSEQCQRIALRAGVMVEPAVAEWARAQVRAAKKGGIRLASEPVPPNQVKVVRDVLQKLVHEYATPDQEERYEIEKKRRAASRRETATLGLVARIDRTLILSTGQRERILRVLDSNWDEEWGVVSGVIDDDPGPLPAIPDRLIVPCLSAAQQRAWGRLEKQGIDATFAYVAAVEAIMDGIPSEFSDWLEAGARQTQKPPGAEKEDNAKKGSR
jgi:hypothetical protein